MICSNDQNQIIKRIHGTVDHHVLSRIHHGRRQTLFRWSIGSCSTRLRAKPDWTNSSRWGLPPRPILQPTPSNYLLGRGRDAHVLRPLVVRQPSKRKFGEGRHHRYPDRRYHPNWTNGIQIVQQCSSYCFRLRIIFFFVSEFQKTIQVVFGGGRMFDVENIECLNNNRTLITKGGA